MLSPAELAMLEAKKGRKPNRAERRRWEKIQNKRDQERKLKNEKREQSKRRKRK